MSKQSHNQYDKLKTSLTFLSAMLEEGSLVRRYHKETREELADVLRILIEKVEGLPDGCPQQLIESTAVRAIIDASEEYRKGEEEVKMKQIEKRMREAEMSARIKGFELNEWEQIGAWEFQSSSKEVEGFVYVTPESTYDLIGISEEMFFD
ncbi:MAG: hypothetical protein AAF490_32170 [Chloroflexota bacterium]